MRVPPRVAAETDRNLGSRTVVRLLRVTVVIGGALTVVGSSALIAIGQAASWWFEFYAFIALFSVFFAVFGWLVASHQPHNPVVWTMAASAFFGGLSVAGVAGAAMLVDDPSLVFGGSVVPADLPGPAAWSVTFTGWAPIATTFLPVTLGLLLFPNGKLPSPRWRWVGVLGVVGLLVTIGAEAWGFRPSSTVPIEVVEQGTLINAGIGALMVATFLSLVALVGRFRRSSGETREQFKWVVWGASIFVLVLLTLLGLVDTRYEGLSFGPFMAATAIFLASYGIAVGKYRLYDIDLVISKTVTYVSLTIVIALLYGTAVLGFIWIFGSDSQRGGDLGVALPIGATALVAIAFEPIRSRLQRWANRLAYGRRAAPHEVLSQVTSQLSDTSAGEGLSGLARLLREGTGAESAVVWLRVGERLHAVAASPAEAVPDRSDVGDEGDLPGSELEFSVPVRHTGELLGALGITKPSAYPVTPADEGLLRDVGAGAGMLLRNLRLNAELAERALQLQASRRRLIAAHDAARHRLERDLHDGAQQQVVALKVKLGLAKTVAEREGAADLAARVANLADDTQQAVDAMRIVARGIYPPLLEAEGLGPALAGVHRTAKFGLRIESGDLPRYSRQVEETIYFCVLAAVGRAETAGAISVDVTVHGDESSLTITVTYEADDAGGDLTPLTDRVDAYGGTVTITTTANRTTLLLELPVEDKIMESA